MLYGLPRGRVFNRLEFIENYCRDKSVIHLGACQGNDDNDFSSYDGKVASAGFLHTVISRVASRVVGIDYNRKFIAYLKEKFGVENIFFGDIEKEETLSFVDFVPDVVVFGEILEHFSNPGLALSNIANNIMKDSTRLIITIPNGLSAWNFLWTMLGKEAHDDDHSLLFTPRIVSKLLEKNGLKCENIFYYQSTFKGKDSFNYYDRVSVFRPKSWAPFLYLNMFVRVNPGFSDGLIVEAVKIRA